MNGQWLWYPGEFEFLLYNKLMLRRLNRDKLVQPGWRVDRIYSCVSFERSFTIDAPLTVHIAACGQISVFLNGMFNVLEHFDGSVHLPSGTHTLVVQVYNDDGLPCIFVEGGENTGFDGEWIASCGTYERKTAEYRNFTDKNYTPNDYALPVRKQSYVRRDIFPNGVLYDFGREMMAFPVFSGGRGEAHIFYGETYEEALDTPHSEVCEGLRLGGVVSTPCARAFRYLFVAGGAGADVYANEEYRPIREFGYFRTSDKEIGDIFKICYRTLVLNSREFFLDGIKRDRWVWSGDVYACLYFSYYTFFDPELAEDSLTVLFGKFKAQMHVNYIPAYSLFMILSLCEHMRFTGRMQYVEKMYGKAVDLMEFCLGDCNENGWLGKTDPMVWDFVDWADLPKDETGEVLSYVQVLLVGALNAMAEMGEKLEDGRAVRYRRLAEERTRRLYKDFWTETDGFIYGYAPNGAPFACKTRYSEIFALRLGLLNDESKRKKALNKLLAGEAMQITTPFMKFFELDALAQAGETGEVLKRIRAYWGLMVNLGAECAWEEFVPDNAAAASVGEKMKHKYGRSKCHAWSAGPVCLLPKYIAGVRPLGGSYENGYIACPDLAALPDFDALVPTGEHTGVHIRWNNGILAIEASADGVLQLPAAYNIAGADLEPGYFNGEFAYYDLPAGKYNITVKMQEARANEAVILQSSNRDIAEG